MLNQIITTIVTAILGWLVRHFQEVYKDNQLRKADEAKTAAATKALEDAKTPEERDASAKQISNNF